MEKLKTPREQEFMLVYGKQVVLYLCQYHSDLIYKLLYVKNKKNDELLHKFRNLNFKREAINISLAQKLVKSANHQGFIARVPNLVPLEFANIKKFQKLLVLCGITDVGNIGAIIRSAYALGIEGVIFTNTKDQDLSGAVKSSAGAIFSLPFSFVLNPLDLINELKMSDFTLLGADMAGIDVNSYKCEGKFALFLGSEGDGLSGAIKDKITTISIPMKNNFNSLNVSVAAGILMQKLCNGV